MHNCFQYFKIYCSDKRCTWDKKIHLRHRAQHTDLLTDCLDYLKASWHGPGRRQIDAALTGSWLLLGFKQSFGVAGSWSQKELTSGWLAYLDREAALACNSRICSRGIFERFPSFWAETANRSMDLPPLFLSYYIPCHSVGMSGSQWKKPTRLSLAYQFVTGDRTPELGFL
jgi:hypothetical protein